MAVLGRHRMAMPRLHEALPGRDVPVAVPERHVVLGTPLVGPFPANLEQAVVGMGCFWGAEKKFWQLPGVFTTAVGYAGGFTKNPTYQEVCSETTSPSPSDLVRKCRDSSHGSVMGPGRARPPCRRMQAAESH